MDDKNRCIVCNVIIPEGKQVCNNCVGKVTLNKCPVCGTIIETYERVCELCKMEFWG